MNRTLGLDLGTNSLGWAILDDDTGAIADKGVVVFPEGIDVTDDSINTPAAKRRAARMGRRMKFRRKLRKWHLLALLIDNKMCPLSHEDLDMWRTTGKYPTANKAFISWLRATDASNPYCDRAAAAEKKVDPLTLGRALYHICQRRGFKSSRKEEGSNETGEVKSSISKLSSEIEAHGAKTLGQYFYQVLSDSADKLEKTKIRKRYTGRTEHYEKEFSVIMDVQGYNESNPVRQKIHNAIFMQRPLRSQKHLVGKCPLEPKSPRAQIGHPAVEEFRMLQYVNNLALEDEDGNYRDDCGHFLYPLSDADRKLICSAYDRKTRFEFKAIRNLFKKDERFTKRHLRFHYHEDDESILPCATRYEIASAFEDVTYDEQKVFDALMFFDDDQKLQEWFAHHFPALSATAIAKLVSIHPKEGNAGYSLKAINKMLPFLRKGLDPSFARILAKLPDLIPDFAGKEEEIITALKNESVYYHKEKTLCADPDYRKSHKLLPLLDRYQACLAKYGLSEEGCNKLYIHNGIDYVSETEYKCHGETQKLDVPRLPPVQLGMIRNPLVQRSMTTLRRLVNYLGDHGKIDPSDTIRIELARNVDDLAHRRAIQEWQKSRQALRNEAKDEITKLGLKVTEDAIERYVLWKEQPGNCCLYTGEKISVTDLLSGNHFDIEHTIPRSLSGDDSLANKTICQAHYNRDVKKGRIPKDCPNWDEIDVRLREWRDKVAELEKNWRNQNKRAKMQTDPKARNDARTKALVTKLDLDYWRDKLKRFEITSDRLAIGADGLGGFKKRQLVDTGIMSSHAVDFLRCIYPATFAVNGTATAFARKAWGIQDDAEKDRSDHTHHAKDAMVIAALTPSRFNTICSYLKDDARDSRRECDVCPSPYDGFAGNVRSACEEILVKHISRQTALRQSTKRNVVAHSHYEKGDPNGRIVKCVNSRGDTVRGQLHKDTFYGRIHKSGETGDTYVVRVSLVGPVKNAKGIVDKIIDPAIRSIVATRIEELESSGTKNIEPGMVKMPSGVPINKVRIEAQTTNPQVLGGHTMPSKHDYKNPYYVVSGAGSNFRLGVICKNGKYSFVPDNLLTWAQQHKHGDYTPIDQQAGFVGYITPGAMALAYHPGCHEELFRLKAADLAKRLYKVVKFENPAKITLRFHREARAATILSDALKSDGKPAKGDSFVNLDQHSQLLRLSSSTYVNCMLFEGIHFRMKLDGTIEFMKDRIK